MTRLASAQIESETGQIEQNLNQHYQMVEFAISKAARLILFPEMSITGYCREEGVRLAFEKNDLRLNRLQELSNRGNIVIIVGAPIIIEGQLHIGAFILSPNKSIQIYTKHYLHDGEELYYSPSMKYNPSIKIGGDKISLAICADINNPAHPHEAKINQSTFYLPSIFFSSSGVQEGNNLLEKYAKEYSLNILMSNYCGYNWDMKAGGKSSFWDSTGNRIAELKVEKSGMILIDNEEGKWTASTYEVKGNHLQLVIRK